MTVPRPEASDEARGATDVDPLVSVVVLTHDRPESLGRCLESLRTQSCPAPIEVIVADDGSGAATAAVVRRARDADPRVRHVRHEHRGIPATRNMGVAAARGRYVAIVADDYVLAPDYLTVALDYLDRHPEAAVVRFDIVPTTRTLGARMSHCYYEASLLRRLSSEGISADRLGEGCATRTLEAAGAAVFRRRVLDEVGPWDESLLRTEDTEQTARLRAAGHEVHVLFAGTVATHYQALPLDTLRKCFLTGRYRTHLPAGAVRPPTRPDRLRALGRAVDRARLGSGTTLAFAVVLPGMVAFEGAVALGDLCERLRSSGRGRRRR